MASSRSGTFNFPTTEDRTSVRARAMTNIQLTQNKERTNNYKRWSEKATIVSYSSKTDTYNIIVSALNVSSSTQKSNRVIRDIKAIIPSNVHQFNPGDSVLIGYESDKRESPVILGLRKNNTSVTNIAGGGGGAATPSITPPCDLRIVDDDGNTVSNGGQIICDCSEADATGTLNCCLRVECAVGNVQWAWTGATSCLTSDCFTSSIESGTNARKFCLSKTVCNPIDPATDLPFLSTVSTTALVRCFRYGLPLVPSCASGCNVFYYACDGTEVTSKITFCSSSGECGSLGLGAGCCPSPAIVEDAAHGTDTTDISALIPSCGSQPNTPALLGNDLAEQCGWFEWQEDGHNILLETNASTLAIMRANGCCPCTIIDGTTVTARDETGRSITITVKTQVVGGITVLNPSSSSYSTECGS